MRRARIIGAMSLFVGIAVLSVVARSGGPDRGIDRGTRSRFNGAWRFAWLEQPDAGGKVHRIDCCGLLVFTPDGHMSVQVMEKNPQPPAQTGPEQYSQGGYEASYGTYQIDESAYTFTFHVEGALVRSLIGKDLPRAYQLSGKKLIVQSTHPDEHWRVAWEHY